MKRIAPLVLALLTSGCVSFNNVGRNDLPESWIAAMRRPATAVEQFAGTYSNEGEEMAQRRQWDGNKMHVGPEVAKAHLAYVLSADARRGIEYDPASATTVELKIVENGRVELIARRASTVIARRTFESSWDEASGALILLDDAKAGADTGIAALGRQLVRLFKGADGCLYVQHKRAMAGTVFVVVPMATGEETWGRYPMTAQNR